MTQFWIMLELLFAANAATNQKRLVLLERVDLKLKILKTMIRLAYDVRALDVQKYLLLQEKLFEIGRMLGGWIKETKTNL
ncbi:MAG: four helix bundle protein [Patescibacteria group bacterium]